MINTMEEKTRIDTDLAASKEATILPPIVPGIRAENQDTFAKYVSWKTMPSLLRRPPKNKDGTTPDMEEFAASLGIDEPEQIALLMMRTQKEFADRYAVDEDTLTLWNEKIKQRDLFADLREFALPLHKNVMLSLYNKTIRGGLPEHYALWFKVFAQWSEKMQLDLTKRTVRTIRYEIVDQRIKEIDPADVIIENHEGDRPTPGTYA